MALATHKVIRHANDVEIPANGVWLRGDLSVPDGAQGIVLFAHGSGSSRHSPRNQLVARTSESVVGTLLFDLLTRDEEKVSTFKPHDYDSTFPFWHNG